jgi:hypothetical protein
LLRALLWLCLLASPALAEPSLLPADVPEDAVRVALHTWHQGEQRSGLGPFLGAGLATGLTGGLFVAQGSEGARGAGWALLGFGVLEAAAGLYFGLSAPGKEAARDAALTADRAAFLSGERARVARITGRFQPLLLAVEAAVTVGGGVTAGVGALEKKELLVGLGLGLAVQGLVLFLLDRAVLDRAQAYGAVLEGAR